VDTDFHDANDLSCLHTIPDFDPLSYGFPTDLDPFDMFDPAFDLDGIDAILQGNLDLSFPTQFQNTNRS